MLLAPLTLLVHLGPGGSQMWKARYASVFVLYACLLLPEWNYPDSGALQSLFCLICVNQPLLKKFWEQRKGQREGPCPYKLPHSTWPLTGADLLDELEIILYTSFMSAFSKKSSFLLQLPRRPDHLLKCTTGKPALYLFHHWCLERIDRQSCGGTCAIDLNIYWVLRFAKSTNIPINAGVFSCSLTDAGGFPQSLRAAGHKWNQRS